MSKTSKSVNWDTTVSTDSGEKVSSNFVTMWHDCKKRKKGCFRPDPYGQPVSRLGYTSNKDRQYDHRRQIGRPRLEKEIKEYEKEIKKWEKDIKNIQKELDKKPNLTFHQYPNKERGDIDYITGDSMTRRKDMLKSFIEENLEEIAPLKRLLEEDDRLAEDDKLRGGKKTKKRRINNRKTKKRVKKTKY
jgi:hypothetical protein